jgi:hypothetical protein
VYVYIYEYIYSWENKNIVTSSIGGPLHGCSQEQIDHEVIQWPQEFFTCTCSMRLVTTWFCMMSFSEAGKDSRLTYSNQQGKVSPK